jgi:hypothetical protein
MEDRIEINGVTYVRAGLAHAAPNEDGEQFVLICTDKRGVFAGWVTDPTADPLPVRGAQMAVYWSAAMRGVTGLATQGPDADCRISDPADLTLNGITMVASVTASARERWESKPWKS